jgi:hypothetical protein
MFPNMEYAGRYITEHVFLQLTSCMNRKKKTSLNYAACAVFPTINVTDFKIPEEHETASYPREKKKKIK